MTGWGLRIQKVEMGRCEILKKQKRGKEDESVLRQPSDKNVIEMPVGAVV